MNVTTILSNGSQTGLGYAERIEVEQLLAVDPEAQSRWHRTHAFLPAEQVLSPEAVASFSRWLSSRPAGTATTATHPPATTRGSRAAATGTQLAGAPELIEEKCGAGISRFTMAPPDKLGAWAKLGQEALDSGRARISTPRH